jgi:hypothetical protein
MAQDGSFIPDLPPFLAPLVKHIFPLDVSRTQELSRKTGLSAPLVAMTYTSVMIVRIGHFPAKSGTLDCGPKNEQFWEH